MIGVVAVNATVSRPRKDPSLQEKQQRKEARKKARLEAEAAAAQNEQDN